MISLHPVRPEPDVPATPGGPAPRGLAWLVQAPHRLMFGLGVVGLLTVSLWWGGVLAARAAGLAWPIAIVPSRLHAALMIHGFMPFFFWGFLFTAGPRWLRVEGPGAAALLPAAVGALAAVIAMPVAASLPGAAAAIGLGMAALALSLCSARLAVRYARLLVASRVADTVHARLLPVALGLGVVASFAFAVGLAVGRGELLQASIAIGLWGFCVPVFIVVAHRMLPCFDADGLRFVPATWRTGVLWPLVGGAWVHGLAVMADAIVVRAAVDALVAGLLLAVVLRRGLLGDLRSRRLVAMLQVGLLWLAVSFALFAADGLLQAIHRGGLALAPMHALTIGGFGSLVLAMVSRVSCGRSGRTVSEDRLTARLFVLFQAAALLRIAADLQASVDLSAWLSLAAITVWLATFGAWAARYLPIYLGPRADGRAG